MMDRENESAQQSQTNGGTSQEEQGEEYDGLTERELVFKFIAAHAMVDGEFYRALRADPSAAIAQLHFWLDDEDLGYIKGINWDEIDKHADAVREALQAERVVRSLW